MTHERLETLKPLLKEHPQSQWWRLVGQGFIKLEEWTWLCTNRETIFTPTPEFQSSLDPNEKNLIEQMTM